MRIGDLLRSFSPLVTVDLETLETMLQQRQLESS